VNLFLDRRGIVVNFALIAAMAALAGALAQPASAQIELDSAPFHYSTADYHDAVTAVQEQLDRGDARLEYDDEHGYLKSVLKLLKIDPASQVLVHSKTSFQLRRISPRRPRAVYFNDDVYIGWVQQGDVIEVMATDPELGETFYTVSQEQDSKARFVRDRGQCLTCHSSSRTQGVPGALVRSSFVDAGGQPHYGAGTFLTSHRSPLEDRWGGWYVTGTHGEMRHMGNAISPDRQNPRALDRESGANLTDLSERIDVAPYLTPHSDLVALLLLDHQTQMHNYIARASYETRSALHYDRTMNEALKRPADHVSETTERRIAGAGYKLLEYLLFVDEFRLTSPVKGTSDFAKHFQALGPKDHQGRSLRDLDLNTRLLKYPCSYLIYSPSFDQLPQPIKQCVVDRLHKVLTGKDQSSEFAHLSPADRQAILEILTETKPGLWGE
jgi:hypothetical protein